HCGAILEGAGMPNLPVGMVAGDDVLESVREWISRGIDLSHLETGEPISSVVNRLVAANVYFGARPITQALAGGARIVLTGRVADASLTLGPAIARFGWAFDDWAALAGASVAGHLIECGAQATGGLWRRWDQVTDPASIGYPIAEIEPDGSCVIAKP